MIHHKSGDIVQYINEDGNWCWGIILGPPPTVEQIAECNTDFEYLFTADDDRHSVYWCAYDSYIFLTGAENFTDFALPTDVFKPMHDVPGFVKNTLTAEYNISAEDYRKSHIT